MMVLVHNTNRFVIGHISPYTIIIIDVIILRFADVRVEREKKNVNRSNNRISIIDAHFPHLIVPMPPPPPRLTHSPRSAWSIRKLIRAALSHFFFVVCIQKPYLYDTLATYVTA